MIAFLVALSVVFSPFVAKAIGGNATSSWEIRTFRNQDYQDPSNPQANLEVHCISKDANGHPTYVRGTYGQRGYFEGAFEKQGNGTGNGTLATAQVTWTDVGYEGNKDLYVEAGAGVLKYDNTLNFVEGYYYSAGYNAINFADSWGEWGITGPCNGTLHDCTGAPANVSDADIALQLCFWDVTGERHFEAQNVRNPSWSIFGKEDPNTWYVSNLGYNAGGQGVEGPVLGAYKYTYSKQECKGPLDCTTHGNVENGVYGTDTSIQVMNNSYVATTIWYASSGPYKGQDGSGLYAFVAGPGGQKQQMIGWFCNTMPNKNHTAEFPNTGKLFTSCSIDNNDWVKNSKTESLKLFGTYKKYSKWFDGFKNWAQAVFGK